MNKVVEKIIANEKAQRLIVATFLSIVFFIIAFLCLNLIKFYRTNIVTNVDAKLFYNFTLNTVPKDVYISNDDISEEFISYGVSYGIDVSEWQGNIDWQKVANTGISFAFIRCGFRQTSGSEIKEDANFRQNIVNASAAGLKVGVYFFGTARNQAEALEEANFTYNLVKDYKLTYPVVYDIETFDTGRLTGVSYSTITDNILTFTETIEGYGYSSMVYTNRNAFMGKLDTGKLDGKLIWLAHYADQTDYKGNYNAWQYSSEGRVDGINGNVDLNVSYFTYVADETQVVENPNYVYPPEVTFTETNEEVITTTRATMRNSATDALPNRLGYLPYGTRLVRTGVSPAYSKILYNGRVIYIANNQLRVA